MEVAVACVGNVSPTFMKDFFRDNFPNAKITWRDGLQALMREEPDTGEFVLITDQIQSTDLTTSRQLRGCRALVLLTDRTVPEWIADGDGSTAKCLDHVVSLNGNLGYELRFCLRKYLNQDFFGIQQLLAPGTPFATKEVTDSRERPECHSLIVKYAAQFGIKRGSIRHIRDVSEELLMNAIYDAPHEGGTPCFDHLPRTTPVSLKPHQRPVLTVGCDGSIFALALRDPFGALSKESLMAYLGKSTKRFSGEKIVDNKAGGAGLGMLKILFGCHILSCVVETGKWTEVLAAVYVTKPLADISVMPRSVHFFQVGA